MESVSRETWMRKTCEKVEEECREVKWYTDANAPCNYVNHCICLGFSSFPQSFPHRSILRQIADNPNYRMLYGILHNKRVGVGYGFGYSAQTRYPM